MKTKELEAELAKAMKKIEALEHVLIDLACTPKDSVLEPIAPKDVLKALENNNIIRK